jgi:hypothetical protein
MHIADVYTHTHADVYTHPMLIYKHC